MRAMPVFPLWKDGSGGISTLSCLLMASLLLSGYLVHRLVLKQRTRKAVATQLNGAEKTAKPDWDSISFEHFQPKEDFDWTKQPSTPHRPWRNGPHFVTMGIKRTGLEDWVEIDQTYLERYRYKVKLFTQHPDETIQHLPHSDEPSHEALALLADMLPRRYPCMFRATAAGIDNLVTGDSWDLRRDSALWKTHHPLQVMGLLSTEDWFILQPDEQDAQITRLRAGANCFPAGWKLRERIGLSLWEIHANKVPHYEEKLAVSMDRFFQRLRVDSPVQRFNFAIDSSPELFHIDSHHNLTPDPAHPVQLDDLFLRVERQFLQRLPRTRGIVFSIRTYVTPIREVTRDRDVAVALRANVDSLGPLMATYKNKPLWQDVLAAHLDEVVGQGKENVPTQGP